jgi:hypothetical protein
MRTGVSNGIYTGVTDSNEQGLYTGINDGLEQGLYYETILKEGIVTNGLQLYYDIGFSPCYPKSGTTATDLSGNNRTGTLVNSPLFQNEIYGALNFSPSGRPRVNAGNIGDYRTISYTLETWVFPINPSNNPFLYRIYILTKSNSCIQSELLLEFGRTANRFSFVYRDDIILTSAKVYPLNNWYHAVITRNNNGDGTYTSTLYVNSLFDQRATVSFGGSGGSGNVNIGDVASCNQVSSFPGKVAVARIYNRTLTPNEIAQNFNATKYKFLI